MCLLKVHMNENGWIVEWRIMNGLPDFPRVECSIYIATHRTIDRFCFLWIQMVNGKGGEENHFVLNLCGCPNRVARPRLLKHGLDRGVALPCSTLLQN